jgi:hypothetical protein
MPVFARDPTFRLPPWAISKFATDTAHALSQDLAEAMIGDADFNYRTCQWTESEGYSGPDTLDKLEQPVSALLDLLQDKINRHRLGCKLAVLDDNLAEIPIGPDGVWVGTRGGFAEVTALESLLERVQVAAPKAHRPKRGRGRPKTKSDLEAAYRSLARNWRLIHGDDKFTNTWAQTENGLQPISLAARFIYHAICLIDPARQNLAVDLQAMMERDIVSIPGSRPGRRKSFL